ncbi:YKT6-family R-SNARE protein (macronuclear) [Tetrahymena thermophila SB210]|uniref:YKT6-family R-SNARE protein n=1 Tax=Tetrahymena thermophila (strain SB210) TaxID=312017 RepID=I7MFF6_TETTS|nr:YKT6-family R-SNARE protein [Tetrahymena thermophila SB210]EAR83910.2 YKT6-family R-SNARE protein [Tetrahymena thermophila SB210]|eukprot:XP_001031573.2 YKT6-family R-SNARE protein [Tetrahymena thermophila SB210]
MRLISMHVLKWNAENPIFLSSAYELGFISWYQRSFFKEGLIFGVRTITGRVQQGTRTAIKLDEAKAIAYVVVQNNRAVVIVCDEEYPQNVPFIIIREIFSELDKIITNEQVGELKEDTNINFERLQVMVKEYQDYKKADKLAQLQSNLQELQEITFKVMTDLVKKGEDLKVLMEKSKDLSQVSVNVYKQSKKFNSRCCVLI